MVRFGQHEHHSYPHMVHKKDKNGISYPTSSTNDSDHDPSSLFIPTSFLEKQTPAMRQWWEFKAAYHDIVLFFKVGKFYELYHSDADIGVKEVGLVYMKGTKAHSGFPEAAYGKYVHKLVFLFFGVHQSHFYIISD